MYQNQNVCVCLCVGIYVYEMLLRRWCLKMRRKKKKMEKEKYNFYENVSAMKVDENNMEKKFIFFEWVTFYFAWGFYWFFLFIFLSIHLLLVLQFSMWCFCFWKCVYMGVWVLVIFFQMRFIFYIIIENYFFKCVCVRIGL